MKGNVLIELFDQNKQLVQKEEKHNFIALPFKEFAEYALRGLIASNIASASKRCYYPNASISSVSGGFFRYLALTNNTDAESPTTEYTLKGDVIGSASKIAAYSGTDPLVGTINESETVVDNKKIKMVFDFATDKANGTFQSVSLVPFDPIYGIWYLRQIPLSVDFEADYVKLTFGGGFAWATDLNNVIHKLDATTLQSLDSWDVGQGTIRDLEYYDGYVYYATSANGLRKLDINLGVELQIYSSNSFYSICVVGSQLYVAFNTTLYEISTDGTLGTSYSGKFSGTPSSLTHDGTDFFYTTSNQLFTFTLVDPYERVGFAPTTSNSVSYNGSELIVRSLYNVYQNGSSSGAYSFFKTDKFDANMTSRVLLPSSVTKNNTQTMKVTYTITWA